MSKKREAAFLRNGGSMPECVTHVVEKVIEVTDENASPAAGRPYFDVVMSLDDSGNGMEFELNEQQRKLLAAQGVAIDLLLKSYNSMIELAAVRLECKLSNTRVSGVARELRELIKVMSVYDC